MWGKFKLLWVVALFLLLSNANGQYKTQPGKPVRLLIIGSIISGSFSGQIEQRYLVLRAFVVNYSDDTLRFWTKKCRPNEFFTLTKNDYMHIVNERCDGPLLEKIIVPPHRSFAIPVRMALDKQPHEIVHLKVGMKLYKSLKFDNFDKERASRPELLTDSLAFNYKTYGNSYDWNADWEQEQKRKLNLPTTGLHLLSIAERKLYTVTVYAGKINKIKINKYPFTRLEVPAIIINNSDKTLKYYSMTCSWWEFYHIDNKYLGVDFDGCDSNFPTLVTIPPHSSHTDIVSVISDKNGLNRLQVFKLGLNINICEDTSLFDLYDDELRIYNIVWSNEIQFTPK